MEIYERINKLIKAKKITKRRFSEILRDLEPKLKSTGETPTEKTIYKYLSGDISIPIELISYIAEALNISEQELFDTNLNTKLKLYKYIVNSVDTEQLSYLQNISSNASVVNSTKALYGKKQPREENIYDKEEIEKLFSLIEYAPKELIEKITKRLEEIKRITLESI
ncbi:hypothetical protein ALC152_07490 [Arcobacter sp. 15-2]|uniref:hypothetical protein n=1 Tax=Arcobacter sp. 15-2 TaxID=3374109 RepID=UPI00399D3A4A